MHTRVVFFPFDLFGGGGGAAGVDLLGEAIAEILDDQRHEKVPTRADSYAGKVKQTHVAFETLEDYQHWRARGRRAVRLALQKQETLLWIAGNHLGALPVYDELSTRTEPMLVVQFDAHLDIHHFAECNPEPTHGNFLLHCAGPLPPVINIGHRDLLIPAAHWQKSYRTVIPAAELAADFAQVQERLRLNVGQGTRIWIDLDWDALDPAYFPAVARPVPFGMTPLQLLGLIEQIPRDQLAGVLISEFEPGRDRQDQSLATAVWLLEHLLLALHER